MRRVLLLTLLCLAAYAPTLRIPLIEDDYPNITLARNYGSAQGSHELWADSTFRLRATSFWVMRAMWSGFRLNAPYWHALSLLLHIASTLLLYHLASRWEPMRRGALWAAAFFAIHEGHQEAVMWASAINELLLFVFGIGAMICWLRAVRSPWWHMPGMILFGLALLSKESAIILLPLFLLVRWQLRWSFLPYCAEACMALLSILQSRANSFRFSDGSFSWHAPFWITLPRGTFRLLWIWGFLALLFWIARKQPMRPFWLALIWIALALLPYAFLTYSTAIPSRQVYLASAGLAMFVGLAFQHLTETADRRLIWVVGAAILLHNAGILWTRKRSQFLERAAPTERLLAAVHAGTGPIYMRCFPQTRLISEEAVRLAAPDALPRLVWDGPAKFCP